MIAGVVLVAAAPGSKQAAYDAAQLAFDKGDYAAAASGFAPLLPAAGRPLNPSQAVIAVRLADSLDHLDRRDEARAMADRAIPALGENDPTSLAEGWRIVAEAAGRDFDIGTAQRAYAKAIDYAARAGDEAHRLGAALDLAALDATIDPAGNAALLDPLLGDKALVARLDKLSLASLEDARARAALNAGDLITAKTWIDRALQHSGGLDDRVTQREVAIRGDAAIIAHRRHDPENERKYLTYTGAGHLDSIDWVSRYSGDLPVCGTDGDIRPDDEAVVEFSIDEQGRVGTAAPVYANRPGEVGTAFARAVRDWHWKPTDLAKVSPFWRSAVRLELRCETRPDPESLWKPAFQASVDWLRAQGVEAATERGHLFVADPALRDRDDLSAVPAMIAALGEPKRDPALLPRLSRLLDAHDAPASIRALVLATVATQHGSSTTLRAAAARDGEAYGASVPAFVARYPNSREAAWLRLEWANALERAGNFAAARPLLEQVMATPAKILDESDPLRQVATLHIAIVRTRMGDAAGAKADLATAGLDAERCSLVDTRPVPTNLNIVSSQFPTTALEWHFEGYVQVAYDIGVNGRVANIRTVVAYPPFVFGPATEKAALSFRYAPPTLDGKPVGCTSETQRVNYRIPS